MSIPVKVCVRVRPLSAKELREKSTDCVEYYSDNQIALNGKSFTFDRVFKPEVTQDAVYDACAAPLVDSLFKGFNASILAYGQTGSGKTFTMGTEDTDTMSSTSRGLIPRMVESIFTRIAAAADPALFSVTVSMLEVYDEKVYDLLAKERGDPLDIKESSKGVYIKDLSHKPAKSLTDTMSLLEKGCGLRKKGSTAMNEQSSRSHAVFTVVMQKYDTDESTCFEAKLSLVDLAGSERLKKTMAVGERKKEGIKINEGLLALGHVISALSDREKHVPYRNSSITRILQDSLGGNSFTVMVACASPAVSNGEETLSTLRYAYRTKSIKNKPIVNIDPATAALKQLREENRNLKSEILRLKGDRFATPRHKRKATLDAELHLDEARKAKHLEELLAEKEAELASLLKESEDEKERQEYLLQEKEEELSRYKWEATLDGELREDESRKAKQLEELLAQKESEIASLLKEFEDEKERQEYLLQEKEEELSHYKRKAILDAELIQNESRKAKQLEELLAQKESEIASLKESQDEKERQECLVQKKEEELSHYKRKAKLDVELIENESRKAKQLEDLLAQKESEIASLKKSQDENERQECLVQKKEEELSRYKRKAKLEAELREDESRKVKQLQELLVEKESELAPLRTRLETVEKESEEEKEALRDLIRRKETAFKIEKTELEGQRDQYAQEIAAKSSHQNRSQKIKYVETMQHRINELESELATLRSATVPARQPVLRSSMRLAKKN